jgi:hypothetical protein
MNILSKLFGQKPAEPQPVEHAVIVAFGYGSTDLSPLFSLESQLTDAIGAASVGEFDGNEVAADGSDGVLYMYGPDADQLFAVVRPVLESVQFMHGARAKLRYGPPQDGVREQTIVLSVQP